MSRRITTVAFAVAAFIAIIWAMHSVDAIAFLKRMHGM
jgi:hypothetical protein